MCVRDHFLGDPTKAQYIDQDDFVNEVEYVSDEDVVFFDDPDDPADPGADFVFGNLDVEEDDDDDPVYDPDEEFGDFLSDSGDETYEADSEAEHSAGFSSIENGDEEEEESEYDDTIENLDNKKPSEVSSDSSNSNFETSESESAT